MAKNAYYFSHDSNARNDPKCSALLSDFGIEGYGLFWMTIEILAEQEGYKLKKFNKLYDGLARQFMADKELVQKVIEAMLHDYELLLEDDSYIWSESLMRRMEEKERKRQTKIDAGRIGGIKSGITRGSTKSNEAEVKQNEAVLEANEPKESKGKESKGKESKVNKKEKKNSYAEFVNLTEDEYKKLVDEHGELLTTQMITILDNYKGANGKKYKSDYRAILNWVIDRAKKGGTNGSTKVATDEADYTAYD